MHLALNLNVQVKDGTLVLTDCAGKTVTFSKAQTVQQKVSMITLGELCGLPKHQLATGFGFKSRTSYYNSRNTVLQGTAADLLPKRTGPHTPSKRTQEVEALIIRTRFETELNMYEIADYGLSKKNGCPLPPSRLDSWRKRRSKSLTAPASRVPALSLGTTSSMTSRLCSNAGSRPPVRVAFFSSLTCCNWAPLTSWRL